MTKEDVHKKDILYYARAIPQTGIFEVCELIIRTVEDDYFVGSDKRDRHAYLLHYTDLDKIVFKDRKTALNKVKEVEKNRSTVKHETYYEEY